MSEADRGRHDGLLLLVQAEFDGELDAAQAAELSAHREGCAACRRATLTLNATRAILREDLYEPLPDALRARLIDGARAKFRAARPAPPPIAVTARLAAWLRPAAGFALGAACAAALALAVLVPENRGLSGEIVASHIRALQPGHLEDVASSDQHTVKPWFDGRLDFAPPVKELARAGFPLAGGRLDYIGGRPVAALAYRHKGHVIDLYVWPQASGTVQPAAAERDGYHLVYWTAGGMNFAAVSDAAPQTLRDFADAWRRTP